MNDKQEFYNKWIYPSYDDVIKKISEEREKFVYFEKDYDKKKKVINVNIETDKNVKVKI